MAPEQYSLESVRRAMEAARIASPAPGVLPDDVDWSPISVARQEIRFLDTLRFNSSQISGSLCVPAHLIYNRELAIVPDPEPQKGEA